MTLDIIFEVATHATDETVEARHCSPRCRCTSPRSCHWRWRRRTQYQRLFFRPQSVHVNASPASALNSQSLWERRLTQRFPHVPGNTTPSRLSALAPDASGKMPRSSTRAAINMATWVTGVYGPDSKALEMGQTLKPS